jgi:hypothetical protein
MDESNDRKPSTLSAAIQAAFAGLVIVLVAIALVLFLFQAPLLVVYPLQPFLYYLVGRMAGNIARNEDPNAGLQLGLASDLNFSATGGLSAVCLSLATWFIYGVISLGLELAQLGSLIGSVLGVTICAALDVPVAIILGSLGGKSAEPRT